MERYRSGHNGADSKGSRPRHLRMCESSRILRFPRKCFIFLEFWMTAFHYRPCKSRAKFKLNLIRRCIEEVITAPTRNLLAYLEQKLPKILAWRGFSVFPFSCFFESSNENSNKINTCVNALKRA